jgi:hypothetical protein
MKQIGYGERGTAIVELSESEFNALKKLISVCGDGPDPDWNARSMIYPETEPITNWMDAVRRFSYEVQLIKDARDLLDGLHRALVAPEKEQE